MIKNFTVYYNGNLTQSLVPMPTESKSAKAIHTSSRAAANSESSSGISRQAVQQQKVPVEKQKGDNGAVQMYDGRQEEPGPFQLKRNNGGLPGQHPSREAWHVAQQKQGHPAPAMKQVSLSKPVVQRALKTKEDVFMDQIKFHVMKGIYHYGTTDAEDNQYYVDALAKLGLINKKTLKQNSKAKYPKNKRITQEAFYLQEKNAGLKGITFDALQTNGLLMDGIRLVEDEASWDQYKPEFAGSRKKNKEKSIANADGVGAKTSLQTDVKTKIQWEPVDGSGEGKKVTALLLGPDHPLGTTPSKATKAKAAKLQKSTGKGYIAGHLLNDHLGGPGNDKRNITAIPKDVNTEQSDKIEEKVKLRVNSLHEVVFYQVEVTYAKDNKTWYASNLRSSFGTYKEGTDFNDPKFSNFNSIPKADLEDFYEHNLPIESPTAYSTGKGYLSSSDTHYTSGGMREPASNLTGLTPGAKRATYDVNVQDHILLKDAKQIKLEFISYAIYSMPIRQLNERIADLEKQSLYKDNLLRLGAREIDEREEEISHYQKEGRYKDKLLSEGVEEINRKEQEIEHYQKEGSYKDKLLSEGVEEINKLEGDIEKNKELLEKLFSGLNKIEREIAQDKKSSDIELSTLDKSDLAELEKRLEVVLGAAERQRLEIEKLKEELDLTRKKLEGVEIERDNYQRLNRRHIGGYGFESAYRNEESTERDEPRSPISNSIYEEGWSRGEQHRKEVDQLHNEKEYYRGVAMASKFQYEAHKLGWEHAQQTDILPDNIPSVLLFGLSYLNNGGWDNGDAYNNGFTDGISNLAPAYKSGFVQGIQDREIARLRREQQRLLTINLQGRGNNDRRRDNRGYPPPPGSNYPQLDDRGSFVTSTVDSYRTPTQDTWQSHSNHDHPNDLDPERGRRDGDTEKRSRRRDSNDERQRREGGGNRFERTDGGSPRRRGRSPKKKESFHSFSGRGGRGDSRERPPLSEPRDRQREERKENTLPLKKRSFPNETRTNQDQRQRDGRTDRPHTEERERKRPRHHSPRRQPPPQHGQHDGNRYNQRGLPNRYNQQGQHDQYGRRDQGNNQDDWFNRNDRTDL